MKRMWLAAPPFRADLICFLSSDRAEERAAGVMAISLFAGVSRGGGAGACGPPEIPCLVNLRGGAEKWSKR